jgi:hypothetical protein
MMTRLLLATTATVLFIGSLARCDDKPAAGAAAPANKDAAEKMAAPMASIMPGPAQQKLAKLVGEWTTVTKFTAPDIPKPDETTGTAKLSMVLGGRFLHEENSGTMMGQPYSGARLTGYNNDAKQYEASWTWTMSTAILRMAGKSNDDGKTINFDASFAGANGEDTRMTVIVKVIDDDHFTVDINGKYPDGSAGPRLETTYTRKK